MPIWTTYSHFHVCIHESFSFFAHWIPQRGAGESKKQEVVSLSMLSSDLECFEVLLDKAFECILKTLFFQQHISTLKSSRQTPTPPIAPAQETYHGVQRQ